MYQISIVKRSRNWDWKQQVSRGDKFHDFHKTLNDRSFKNTLIIQWDPRVKLRSVWLFGKPFGSFGVKPMMIIFLWFFFYITTDWHTSKLSVSVKTIFARRLYIQIKKIFDIKITLWFFKYVFYATGGIMRYFETR